MAPPGTDPAPRAPGGGDPPLILSIGSLIPRKRHDVLVAALARLRGPALAGADRRARRRSTRPARRRSAAQVAAPGLGGPGRAGRGGGRHPARSWPRADVFALASEYEGYGMAFAEALSQGLPVVACRAGAIAELVPEAAGALVPPGRRGGLRRGAGGAARRPGAPARRAARPPGRAGQALPSWADTAALVARALDRAAA